MADPPEGASLPPVDLDPEVEITPYALFRRLREGAALVLVDVRPAPTGLTFRGAVAWEGPGGGPRGESGWQPSPDRLVVLFDDEGPGAREIARRLRSEGCDAVSLFGGLRLYDAALDPEVVGEERYLVVVGAEPGLGPG